MGLKVLVIGGGGREHALAWALRGSAELWIAPGNAGTAALGQNVVLDLMLPGAVTAFCQQVGVDLVVIGPEAPLAAGLVDALGAAGIRAFGPTQAAAQIEASKAFSKAFMQRHGIPTADYREFADYHAAVEYVRSVEYLLVVKADGLAAGKGVTVCDDAGQALAALHEMMVAGAFGDAGLRVVIEERMTGAEVSVLAFCDGVNLAPMPPARDHKRVFDTDLGPNTGGMGAYAPVDDLDPAVYQQIIETVMLPTVRGMAAEGMPYVGVLYAGLMLTPQGPKTLEFNCRFGDPETQALLPLLETDLLEILLACVDGRLDQLDIRWKDAACAAVVAAAPGYPGSYPKGSPIHGLDDVKDAIVFHAGTDVNPDGAVVTSGGRVLAVSGLGRTLDAALDQAYAALHAIRFEGMHYRRDIGRTIRKL